jgi:hypothetical protein
MDRYRQFEIELVKELEAYSTAPLRKIPLEVWNPRRVAAPERHVQLGLLSGYTQNQITTMCETENTFFHDIESMLGIHYSFQEYTLHPVAEQVWLWGSHTLSKYLQLLTMPGAIRSEFYKTKHDKLLEILKLSCSDKPDRRPTFANLLRQWLPNDLSSVSSEKTTADDGPAMIDPPPIVAETSSVLPFLGSLQTPAPRLVLAVRSSVAGRNKTRRSPHN